MFNASFQVTLAVIPEIARELGETSTPPVETSCRIDSCDGYVNVRAQPSANGRLIGRVDDGETVVTERTA